jgi:hypothetical protein
MLPGRSAHASLFSTVRKKCCDNVWGEKILDMKCVSFPCRMSVRNTSLSVLITEREARTKECRSSSIVTVKMSLPNENLNLSTIFHSILKYKILWKSIQWFSNYYMVADGVKLIGAPQIYNAPKNRSLKPFLHSDGPTVYRNIKLTPNELLPPHSRYGRGQKRWGLSTKLHDVTPARGNHYIHRRENLSTYDSNIRRHNVL